MILIILTCWAVLTTLVIAICVASSMRNDAETQALALMTSNAPEPEFMEVSPTPKRSIGDLSYT
jgi:hypothetical protein